MAPLGVSGAWGNDENSRVAFYLARHGEFRDETGVMPYMYREPGYPLFLAAVFAASPEFADVPSWECIEDPECAEATPVRERGWRLAFLLAAVTAAVAFLLTFVLTRSWTVSAVIGGGWSVLLMPLAMAWDVPSTLAGLLLLVHAGLAAQMWRNPRIATGVLSGIALGLLVLNKAVYQYWLAGVAVVLVAGLWRDAARRRTLAPACAALVLAALSLTLPWMARNYVEAGHFTMSGRAGVVLAVRAEYGRATWSEIRGAFAYYLPWLYSWPPSDQIVPFHRFRAYAMRKLEPETFGYTRLDARDLRGFHQSVRLTTGAVAERADLIGDTRWRRCCGGEVGMTEVDVAFKRAAISLIREDWLKHAVLTLAFAERGLDIPTRPCSTLTDPAIHRFGTLVGWPVRSACRLARDGTLLVWPFAGLLAFLAWRRRDVSLALLLLPVACSFGIHAAATFFEQRNALPLLPVLIVATALAVHELAPRADRGAARLGTLVLDVVRRLRWRSAAGGSTAVWRPGRVPTRNGQPQ